MFPCCTGYQNYISIHTNNDISLSKLLTSILAVVKPGQQKYHDTNFSRSVVNQIWILKNSKDLLDTLFSRSPYVCNSFKTFDFSTLHIKIPHAQLKSRNKELIHRFFSRHKG